MFADIEESIINRLQDILPKTVTVEAMQELEKVPDFSQKTPCVFVIYDGYSVADSVVSVPHIQQLELSFYVVSCARNGKGRGDESSAKLSASNLAASVAEALTGHHIGNGRYLRLSDAPGPEYDGGYCFVPLAFSVLKTVRGLVN